MRQTKKLPMLTLVAGLSLIISDLFIYGTNQSQMPVNGQILSNSAIKTSKGSPRKVQSQYRPPIQQKASDPSIYIEGMEDGELTIEEIRAADSLKIKPFELNYKVHKYRWTYVPKDTLISGKSNSAAFPERLENCFEMAKAGDRFIFDQIEVKEPDTVKKFTHSLTFTL